MILLTNVTPTNSIKNYLKIKKYSIPDFLNQIVS